MTEERFRAIRLFKILGNPLRSKILRELHQMPRTPTRLAQLVARPLPAVSRALGILHATGLVCYRTIGASVLYRLKSPEIIALLDLGETYVRQFNCLSPTTVKQAS